MIDIIDLSNDNESSASIPVQSGYIKNSINPPPANVAVCN